MASITIKNSKPTSIKVVTASKNTISINTKGTVGAGVGVDLLRRLRDVDASDIDPGETLVYEPASDKFVVETLPNLDGGEF